MKALYALSLTILACAPAHGAEEPRSVKVIDDISRCRQLQDDAARLACYDTAAVALADASEKRTIVVLDRAEVQRTRRSLFGFTLPKLPFFGNQDDTDDQRGEADVAIQQLNTTIVSIASSGYGLWSMTLAEGGTWRTIEADRSLEPRVGMAITVKRGGLGNYLANIGGRRAVRLKRTG